jgi:hypothetical protein
VAGLMTSSLSHKVLHGKRRVAFYRLRLSGL